MVLTPGWRKVALTAHVLSSVGWFGAVAAFLALAIAGLRGNDARLVGAAYLSMELITWYVIVPSSIASLLSGLVGSLGTSWGLFRHYWVVAKLLVTAVATLFLLVHTQPITYVARAAGESALAPTDLRRLRVQIVADASAALVALIVTTGLAVYKPRGVTAYGRRHARA
jgi:hypothetical protein